MKDGDLHVPCTKMSTQLHTKLKGHKLAGEPPKLQGTGTPRYMFEQLLSTTHKPHNLHTQT